jgi:hypothetical protein
MNLTRIWDWIDKRDIDKHVVSIVVLWGTKILTSWAMTFATAHADKPGLEIAAIIAAVTAPYMALQAAAIKFYFDSRSTT